MRLPTENLRSTGALARFILATIIGLAVDQWSKVFAFSRLASGDSHAFIPGWINFEITSNRGAVFGIGQGQRVLFIVVSILAIGFLTWLFMTSGKQRMYQVLLGLLLAGVLGNMYDRAALGYVRDMIHALPGWKWPGTWQLPMIGYPAPPSREVFPYIFNVADTLLCGGVILMIAHNLIVRPPVEPASADGKKSHEHNAV